MKRGMLLGKFMPPHRGHEYLIRFAQGMVDELTVQVCTSVREPLPGILRYRWMRDHFGGVRVVHNDDENPLTPEEDPEHFWEIWKSSLLARMNAPPDLVFASEGYGHRLAEELGAAFVPVDPLREMVPVAAHPILADPMGHWNDLLPTARPYFVRRVVLAGPESSGKSTLTKWLASQFNTSFVAEYGRTYQENIARDLTFDDFTRIALAHRASEDAASLHANRVLIVDTEAVITGMWAKVYCEAVPPGVETLMQDADRYSLYLLTMPREDWHDDGWRVHPAYEKRLQFFTEVRRQLDDLNRSYVILEGTWEERQQKAKRAVKRLLKGELQA